MKRLGHEMWKYMKMVLDRDGIEYEYDEKTGEVHSGMSARRFKEALEDAFCEKQRDETPDGSIPVYSLKTLHNPEKLRRLKKLNGTGCFVVLGKDVDAYMKEWGIKPTTEEEEN